MPIKEWLKDWRTEIVTIPNILSLIRLLMIPVYVLIYLNATEVWHYYLSAAILALSCLTDMADGIIARRFNMITKLGKLLDPVADKATQFALILCLASRYWLMYLLIVVFLAKEIFQLVAVGLNLRKNKMLDGALMSGKVCTTVMFTTMILMVMLPELDVFTGNLMISIDIVFLLIAFGDYFMAFYGGDDIMVDVFPEQKSK